MRGLGIAVLLLASGSVAWALMRPGDRAKASTDGVRVVSFESHEWVQAVQSGAEVEFVREPALGSEDPTVVRHLRGLGPITDDLVPELVARIGVAPSAAALAAAMERAESGNADDYVAFLKERYCHEKVVRAEVKARQGDYVTLEMSGQSPPVPEGWVTLGQIGAATVGATRVDVWFLFDLSKAENQVLRQMKADWEDAEAMLSDEDVRRFNSQAYELRKQRIDAHLAAKQALQSTSSHARPEAEQRRLRAAMLPNRFVVDASSYTVRRRVLRRF